MSNVLLLVTITSQSEKCLVFNNYSKNILDLQTNNFNLFFLIRKLPCFQFFKEYPILVNKFVILRISSITEKNCLVVQVGWLSLPSQNSRHENIILA